MERLVLLIENHVQFREDHVRFDDEHKRPLTAQKELSASQRHADERLNALIAVVDDIGRRRRPQ